MIMKPGFFNNLLRNLFVVLDRVGCSLLTFIYKIFYNISTATIISGDLIRNFYARIQLILGILMIFKLSMSILNIIINPDSIKDQKQGPSKMVTRVIVSLFMLTLIIPINIPIENGDTNSLNAYINDHGILFGFLYKFQNSMLQENILGKLILGTTAASADPDINNLSDVGGTMALSVARAFIRPDVYDDSKPFCDINTGECPNIKCPTEVADAGYQDDSITAGYLLDSVNVTCKPSGKKIYAFSYTPIVLFACTIIMSIIILGFTIDISVRAIKLAILRLVAPIPIISYIDPKSQKDGAFGNWTKTLVSTYIDLFLRLAIVYFGAFIIQNLFTGGVEFPNSGSSVINLISTVAIIIGILIFMKQAPKFLKDMLGIKGQPMGNAGLAGILGGAAMAIGGGGLAGFGLGMMQGMTTSVDAQAQGKAFSPFNAWTQNRDQMAKIRTGDKDARGGIIGGTMDRLLYNTRERRLNAMGLSHANAKLAKDAFYSQQAEIHKLQVNRDLAYERLKQAGIHGNPSTLPPIEPFTMEVPKKEDYTSHMSFGPDGVMTSAGDFDQAGYDSAMEQYNTAKEAYDARVQERTTHQALWDDFARLDERLQLEQTKGQKMEKNYKNAATARNTMGVDPRMIDEYKARGIFGRKRGAYREGGNHTRFDPYSEGEASRLDDMGVLGGIPEIGGSSGTRSGGPGGPR